MTAVVTRFAPSPTGRLHGGHAYSALRAFDLAAAAGGRFLLRIEDIDGARSRPEHVAAILADLAWLGLAWEGPVYQSARLDRYAAALAQLQAKGLVYPCFCTRAAVAAASLHAPHGAEPVYSGTCRALTAPDLSRPHCWRLDVGKALQILLGTGRGSLTAAAGTVRGTQPPPPSPLRVGGPPLRSGEALWWHDAFAGWIRADPAAQGDVILARKDAPASYHLAVTVDDAAQGVTDVVRGVDLFAATDIHRLLPGAAGPADAALPSPSAAYRPSGAAARRWQPPVKTGSKEQGLPRRCAPGECPLTSPPPPPR